jgi:hypothetical protein
VPLAGVSGTWIEGHCEIGQQERHEHLEGSIVESVALSRDVDCTLYCVFNRSFDVSCKQEAFPLDIEWLIATQLNDVDQRNRRRHRDVRQDVVRIAKAAAEAVCTVINLPNR